MDVIYANTRLYIANSFTQAISNIEYGGPLATTFHHSTAYVLDTSPPLLNDMIITEYSISSNQLEFSYNARYLYITTKTTLYSHP